MFLVDDMKPVVFVIPRVLRVFPWGRLELSPDDSVSVHTSILIGSHHRWSSRGRFLLARCQWISICFALSPRKVAYFQRGRWLESPVLFLVGDYYPFLVVFPSRRRRVPLVICQVRLGGGLVVVLFLFARARLVGRHSSSVCGCHGTEEPRWRFLIYCDVLHDVLSWATMSSSGKEMILGSRMIGNSKTLSYNLNWRFSLLIDMGTEAVALITLFLRQ